MLGVADTEEESTPPSWLVANTMSRSDSLGLEQTSAMDKLGPTEWKTAKPPTEGKGESSLQTMKPVDPEVAALPPIVAALNALRTSGENGEAALDLLAEIALALLKGVEMERCDMY